MSQEFINIRLNKDDDGTILLNGKSKEFSLDTVSSLVLLGYKKEKDKSFHKGLMECSINLFYRSAMALSKQTEFDSRKTEDKVDIEMTHQLRSIAELLVHISNSASWRDGEYHSFDSMEFKRKLEHIKLYCDYIQK